jgi:hypothetical protein
MVATLFSLALVEISFPSMWSIDAETGFSVEVGFFGDVEMIFPSQSKMQSANCILLFLVEKIFLLHLALLQQLLQICLQGSRSSKCCYPIRDGEVHLCLSAGLQA